MDLESANGTYLNGSKIDAARYYELRTHDVIRFADDSKEYVMMKK